MKKIVSIVLIIALAVILCVSTGITAFAEGSVKLTVSLSPSSLTSEGTVSVKATVQNNTSSEITDVVVIFPGDDSEDVGSIAAGDSATRSNSKWTVSSDMLDEDLPFEATFQDGNGNSQTVSAVAKIAKKESTVQATATASVAKNKIEKGEKVKFTFELKNEGNATLEKVSLKAPPLNGGDQLGKTFSLAPGETKIMTWNPSLSSNVDVKPVFTYTANGEKGTAKAETVSVQVGKDAEESAAPAEDSLEVVASASASQIKAGESVSFEVTVRNQGEADLSGLKVTDADGNQVKFTGTKLDAGSAAKGTLEVNPEKTTNYVFTARAEDEDGNMVKASSEPIEIAVDTVDMATALLMDVAISSTQLQKPGPVDFTFKIKNSTGQEIKDIVIKEATLGEIEKIDSMTDATQDVQKSLQIDQTVSYTFQIEGTLADGTKVESETPAVEIKISAATGGITPMLILLLAIVIAIIVVAIVLAVYVHKNKKAGYTAFGKPRNGGKLQSASQQTAKKPAQASKQRSQERPPQVNQKQQRRQNMPREEIEKAPRPQQKKQKAQAPQKKSKGYSDRNKF